MFAAVRVVVRLHCSFKTVSSGMLRLTWRALERLDCSMRCGAVQSCKVLFSPALESANDAVTVSWRCNSAWTYSVTFKENKSPGPSGTFSMRSLGGGSFQAGLRIQLQTIWPVECIYTRLICVHIYIKFVVVSIQRWPFAVV